MTAPDMFAVGGRQDDDAELIEAGRRWDELRRRQNETPPDEEAEQLSAELSELMIFANNAPPATLAGCVVKLRILADPEIGMEAGDRDDDVVSVRHVLAFIEGLAGPPDGAVDPETGGTWITQPDGSRGVYQRRPGT